MGHGLVADVYVTLCVLPTSTHMLWEFKGEGTLKYLKQSPPVWFSARTESLDLNKTSAQHCPGSPWRMVTEEWGDSICGVIFLFSLCFCSAEKGTQGPTHGSLSRYTIPGPPSAVPSKAFRSRSQAECHKALSSFLSWGHVGRWLR